MQLPAHGQFNPTSAYSVNNPELFLIELINHCNIQCLTCARNDSWGDDMAKGAMPINHFKKIFDEIKPFVKDIVLIGLGELLLYKPLVEVVSYIASKREDIQLFLATNGTVPTTEKVLKEVCRLLPTSIMFSVDGVGTTFDLVRKKASYREFVAIIKSVIENVQAIKFSFNMVVFDKNYHDMLNVLNLAKELRITEVHFNSLNLAALPSTSLSVYDFYKTDKFQQQLYEAKRLASNLNISLTTFDFSESRGFKKCMYPWEDFYITWDGFMAQCCAQPFPKLQNFGNVLDNGVMAAVNSPAFFEIREMWQANKTPWMCQRCHKVKLPVIETE